MSAPSLEQVDQWSHEVFSGGARCINEALIEFAALAYAAGQAAEREACAKVCDRLKGWPTDKVVADECAAAIRARGNNGK